MDAAGKCPRCGVGVLSSETVCWNCGGKQQAEAAPPEQAVDSSPEAAEPPKLTFDLALQVITGDDGVPVADTSPVKGTVPITRHLLLYVAANIAGFFLGATAGMALASLLTGMLPLLGMGAFLLPVGGVLLGMHVAKKAFHRLVTAQCPQCGGPAVMEGRKPLSYRCRNCNYLHKTLVTASE